VVAGGKNKARGTPKSKTPSRLSSLKLKSDSARPTERIKGVRSRGRKNLQDMLSEPARLDRGKRKSDKNN